MDQPAFISEEFYHEAANAVRQQTQYVPTVGLILGSGLGTLVSEIEQPDVIDYQNIPHWPHSTVLGHAGKLVVGSLEGCTVVAMQGRAHYYEGYTMAQVTLPVRVMRLLGVDTVLLTNAAGGLNPDFDAGDLMVIEDHIFLPGMMGHNPLHGPNLGAFGPRFSINTHTYNRELRQLAHKIAQQNGFALREGIYVSLSGPSFETPAEVRMLRRWGGDAVGMSTAPEAIVAYHAGMRILGISSVTNMTLDSTDIFEEVSHEEVLRLGKQIVPRLATIIRGVLREMPPYNPSESENQPEHD